MENILSFQTTMNIWPSGSQHKTPHAPKCHYLFRKFIGLLIIDYLIKGKLVRWGDECLFTSGPLVSGWFGERDREASMRRAPRHRTKSLFVWMKQKKGPLSLQPRRLNISVCVSEFKKYIKDGWTDGRMDGRVNCGSGIFPTTCFSVPTHPEGKWERWCSPKR